MPRTVPHEADIAKSKGFSKARALSKARRVAKDKGIRYVTAAGYRRIQRRLSLSFWCNYYRFFKSWKTFTFQQNKYKYFYHKYNTTWRNERAVEIPIVWDIMKKSKGTVLEVGNVLSHYFTFQHDIVDKYEKAEGIINIDVVDISPSKKYDLIVSISTLEHVGWDENPSDSKKILSENKKIIHAIEKLKGLLNPNGKIVVTMPLGYNLDLDELLKSGELKFTQQFFLKRVSKDNRWVETDWKGVKNLKFNSPFPFGNGLIVGVRELNGF